MHYSLNCLDWLLLFGVPVPIAGRLNAACSIGVYCEELNCGRD